MVTSVPAEGGSATLPAHFNLEQNYPNPFNPSTTIAFSLPLKALVSLTIFDVLGREVSRLVTEELSAGTHVRQWNAGGLTSGIYFYRLLALPISGGPAGNFTETRKLLLLR
jgi:hypothetical protein